MYEIVTESELSEIRRNRSQALLGDDQPSRIQQVFGFMRWIRDAILVVLAILIVRQGWGSSVAKPHRGRCDVFLDRRLAWHSVGDFLGGTGVCGYVCVRTCVRRSPLPDYNST